MDNNFANHFKNNKFTYNNLNNKKYENNDNKKNKYYENKDVLNLIEKIKKGGPLHNTLTCEEINLPNCAAYNVGKAFKGDNKVTDDKTLNTNQLRKYFEQINNAKNYEFNQARKELYKVLPQIAYAAGRKVCPPQFYDLMEACISPQTIVSEEDVNTLIEFLTAVVAYSKFNS